MIESVNNELIKKYAKLNQKKYRNEMGLFIVEGEHLILEAKKNNLVVDLFSLDGKYGTKVSESVMRKLSNLDTIPNEIAVCKIIEEKEIKGNILLLDNIQDPGNLGTIIRSAVAFGIDTIIASPDTVDIYNTKVIRSSEGMIFNINYIKSNVEEFILNNKDKFTFYTTDVKDGNDVSKININKPFGLIMGNEGAGVSKNISTLADEKLYIKLSSMCESLNVAMATTILLYEMNK